ncbi:type II toxin-antitoxin system prevent-host-death family antitoxin [Kineosporia rhizophila]|nr:MULTISPECIES: type II toxin-antitoxin system prevent-host-death family antitoxin [Kineosporia]MCE0540453.1 type II toxin-antitoxin system prevent-host-death family antitoxin [Kineosporia rhizophila]
MRDLRQNASDLVRRAEKGEQVTVTVAGRPAAVLGPLGGGNTWVSWEQVADVFRRPVDADWASDRDLVDQSVVDPWER